MKGGPPRCGRFNTVKAQLFEVKRINEGIDRANRIFLIDPIVKALRQERCLDPICAFHEPPHDHPQESSEKT